MKKRPTGITILAGLNLVVGLGMLVYLPLLLFYFDRPRPRPDGIEVPMSGLVLTLTGMTFWALISAYGMWKGARWGWWMAAIYFAHGLVKDIVGIYLVFTLFSELSVESRGPDYYFFKYTSRAIFSILMLVYFFRSTVLDYFEFAHLHRRKAFFRLLGIIVILLAISFGSRFFADSVSG